MTDVRVTQDVFEAIQQNSDVDVRVTQLVTEAIQQNDSVDVRVSQMVIEFITTGDCPTFTPSNPLNFGGGLYIVEPNKTNDTLWVSFDPEVTVDVKIP
jgi:hypothetical protein